MSCGVGRRRGSDPALLQLWCKPVATAPIRPLAWEPTYAAGAALEKEKSKINSMQAEEIINTRTEINKVKSRKTIEKSSAGFRRSMKLANV